MSISAPITATADCPVKALLRRPGGSLAMLTDAKAIAATALLWVFIISGVLMWMRVGVHA